jgi:hypothetical protein
MIFFQRPDGSSTEHKFTFEVAWWLHRVQHAPVLEDHMVSDLAYWLIDKGLLNNLPEDLDDLLDYLSDNMVGLKVAESRHNPYLTS